MNKLRWDEELRRTFRVVPLDGADAAQAFLREALRLPPARGGRGGRDSAIWMTVLRLARDHDVVSFVSRNTRDFAVGQLLHPTLTDEACTVSGAVRYYSSIDSFVASIATRLESPEFPLADVRNALRFDIRDAIEDSEASENYSISPDLLDPESVEISEVSILRSYSVSGAGLALAAAKGRVPLGQFGDRGTVDFEARGWLNYNVDDGVLESAELFDCRATVRDESIR